MTRLDFIEFLKEFRKDLTNNDSKWENKTLEDFLEAMVCDCEVQNPTTSTLTQVNSVLQ